MEMRRETLDCKLIDGDGCSRFNIQTPARELARHLIDTGCFERRNGDYWRFKDSDELAPEVQIADRDGDFTIQGRIIAVDVKNLPDPNCNLSKIHVKIETKHSIFRSPMISIMPINRQVRWDKKEVPQSHRILHSVCDKIIKHFLDGKLRDFNLLVNALRAQEEYIFEAFGQ